LYKYVKLYIMFFTVNLQIRGRDLMADKLSTVHYDVSIVMIIITLIYDTVQKIPTKEQNI